ncbi:unnamed protein product [Sympodiomycopsis kandeliae]
MMAPPSQSQSQAQAHGDIGPSSPLSRSPSPSHPASASARAHAQAIPTSSSSTAHFSHPHPLPHSYKGASNNGGGMISNHSHSQHPVLHHNQHPYSHSHSHQRHLPRSDRHSSQLRHRPPPSGPPPPPPPPPSSSSAAPLSYMRPISYHRHPEASPSSSSSPSLSPESAGITHQRKNYITSMSAPAPASSSSASASTSSSGIPFAKGGAAGTPSVPVTEDQYHNSHYLHRQQYPHHKSHTHPHHHQISIPTTARALGFALPQKTMLASSSAPSGASAYTAPAQSSHAALASDFTTTPSWLLANKINTNGSNSVGGDYDMHDSHSRSHSQGDVHNTHNRSRSHGQLQDIDSLSSDEESHPKASTKKRKRMPSAKSHKPSTVGHPSASHQDTSIEDTVDGNDDDYPAAANESSMAITTAEGKENGKRTRVPQACDLCRKRKARCLNGRPIGAQNPNDPGAKCDRCSKQNADCVWSFFSNAGRQATAARKKASLHHDRDGGREHHHQHNSAQRSGSSTNSSSGAEDNYLDGNLPLLPDSQTFSPSQPQPSSGAKRRRMSPPLAQQPPRRKTLDMAARAAEVKHEAISAQYDSQSQGTQGISDALNDALDFNPESQDVRPQPVTMELGVPSGSSSTAVPAPRQIVSDGMQSTRSMSASGGSSSTSRRRSAIPSSQPTTLTTPPIVPSQRWRNDILSHMDSEAQRRVCRLRRKSESVLQHAYAAMGNSSGTSSFSSVMGRNKRAHTVGVPTSADPGALTYAEGVTQRHGSPDTETSRLPQRPYLAWSASEKLDWLNHAYNSMTPSGQEPAVMSLIDLPISTNEAANATLLAERNEIDPVRVQSMSPGKPSRPHPQTVSPSFPSGEVARDLTSQRKSSRLVRLMSQIYSESDAEEIGREAAAVSMSLFSSQASFSTGTGAGTAMSIDRPATDSQIGEIFDLADAGLASQPSQSYQLSQSQQQSYPLNRPLQQLSQQQQPLNLTQEYHLQHQRGSSSSQQQSSSSFVRTSSFGRVISFNGLNTQWDWMNGRDGQAEEQEQGKMRELSQSPE